MRRSNTHYLMLFVFATALLTGCSSPLPQNAATLPAITTPVNSSPPSSKPPYDVGVSLSRPSVIVGTNTGGPTLVYHAADGGSAPYARLLGCLPAVDGQGNLYLLAFPFEDGSCDRPISINTYSPDAVGGPSIRSLPVGPGTKIANVNDMAVSPAGEIFVNDSSGVAVFSATANGSDSPLRYIQWDGGGQVPVTPEYITVDGKDNLYILARSSIAVFGPHDTGLVTPSRVITGQHTQLAGLGRMTTDIQGNLYVSNDDSNKVGVLEFAPDANGDVAPVRSLTSSQMWNFDGFLGVALDSAGLIYVRATNPYCGAIFVFAADASSSSTPLRVLGGDCPAYDIDGTIAVF